MDKMKLYEALSMIGEDLIIEASEEKAREAPAGNDSEGAVTGVELYRRKGFQRIAAVAAVLMLIAGLSAAGVFAAKGRRVTAPDENIVESVIAVTTKAADRTEAASTAKATVPVVVTERTEGTAAARETASAPAQTALPVMRATVTAPRQTAPVQKQTAPPVEQTSPPASTTAVPRPVVSTAPAVTDPPPAEITFRPIGWTEPTTTLKAAEPVILGGTKTMTIADVEELSKKGSSLTWSDLAGYACEDIGSGIMVLKYDLGDGLWLIVGGLPNDDELYYADLTRDIYKQGIDIRTEDISAYLSG
ncbi:MAG: hypothetical protein IJ071_12835 [Ruminococcus sp.]|nr:hypothetical protein [Ruminococcus sp.]